jgi:rhamnopyranosyl-N-acetylglucosaminyl-diphospho-decaprenol beta-1,3/1,4-galactofuranosyltransferase
MTVAAVVLTYNRKGLVTKCLQGILRQSRPVDAIILVDNASTDGTVDLLRDEGYFSNLMHYIQLKENIGSAGGFFTGVKYACEHGFDWLWLMDDDAIPTPSALENLLRHTVDNHDAKLGGLISFQTSWSIEYLRYRLPRSILEAFVYSLFCPIELNNTCLVPIDHCCLVCLLVPRSVVSRIGFPRKELYFYAEDFDYTLRIRESGYNIFLVMDSLVDHKSEKSSKKNNKLNTLRLYYLYRNNIATIIAHKDYFGTCYVMAALIRYNLGVAKTILIACIQRVYKLAKLVLKAVRDGFRSHLGQYPPTI